MERIKVLVVDDESRMRKLVKDFLKKKNFDVIEACDGEEALDILIDEGIISVEDTATMDFFTRGDMAKIIYESIAKGLF